MLIHIQTRQWNADRRFLQPKSSLAPVTAF